MNTTTLTERDALLEFARMLNSGDTSRFELLLADDFKFSSQTELVDIVGKAAYLAHAQAKFRLAKLVGNPFYADIGRIRAWGHEECVVIALGGKANVASLVFLSLVGGKVASANVCIVPPASAATRLGIYPGLEPDGVKFVSYARPIDLYKGSKSWNELTFEQRHSIASSECAGAKGNADELIITTGLKRAQAMGLRRLMICAQMLQEDAELISRNEDLSPSEWASIRSFFRGTRLHAELTRLLEGGSIEVTRYSGSDLEMFGQTGPASSPLDELEDLSYGEARERVLGHLDEVTKSEADDPCVSLNEDLDLELNDDVDLDLDTPEIGEWPDAQVLQSGASRAALVSDEPSPTAVDYEAAKKAYDAGESILFVDRGLAITAVSIGLRAGPLAHAALLLPLAVLGFGPVWYFFGFWMALLCIPLGIAGFTLGRFAAVQAVRRHIFDSPEMYELLTSRRVAWFEMR